MSRRIVLFALAASAALIGSPALADRECFENSCRLPGAVEMPVQATPPAEPEAKATVEDVQPALVRRPVAVSRPIVPAGVAAPVVQAKAARQPSPVAPNAIEFRTEPENSGAAPADTARVAPGAYARVVAGPAVIYPSYRSYPVYAVAPDAKIISIDSGN